MTTIITIDGPAGSGKSAVAKAVAEALGFLHVDTGAMYRAVTYAVLSHRLRTTDEISMETLLEAFSFTIRGSGSARRYLLGEEDVTEAIRSSAVTGLVSEVAAMPQVRQRLVALQREIGQQENAVFEGRDMGTVVFPNARLKIFLTASPEVRARRRYAELQATHPQQLQDKSFESLLQDINRRDLYDSTRSLSPLKADPQAKVIDTSELTIQQVVDKIIDCLR